VVRIGLAYVLGLLFIGMTAVLALLAAFAAPFENPEPHAETVAVLVGAVLFVLAVATWAAVVLDSAPAAVVFLLIHVVLVVGTVQTVDEGAPFLLAALVVEGTGLAAVLLGRRS
jgi:K+-transporting ATPase A subunit